MNNGALRSGMSAAIGSSRCSATLLSMKKQEDARFKTKLGFGKSMGDARHVQEFGEAPSPLTNPLPLPLPGRVAKLTIAVDSNRRFGLNRRSRDSNHDSAGEDYDTPSSASSSPAAATNLNSVPVVIIGNIKSRPLRPCPPPPNLVHRRSVDSDADSGIGHHRVSTSSSEGDHPLRRATVGGIEWVPIRGPSGNLGIHPASAVRNFPHNERWRPAKIPPPPKDYMLPPPLAALLRTSDESRFANLPPRWSVTGAPSTCPKPAAKKRWSAPAIGRSCVSSLYANVYENTLPKVPKENGLGARTGPVVTDAKARRTGSIKNMCASLASLLSVEDMVSVHARPVTVVPATDADSKKDNYENMDGVEPARVEFPAVSLRTEVEYARVNKPRGVSCSRAVVRKTVDAHPRDDKEPPLPPRNYRSGTPVRRSQSLSRRSIASRVQVLTRTAKLALRKAFSLDALGSAAALKKEPPSSATPSNSGSFF